MATTASLDERAAGLAMPRRSPISRLVDRLIEARERKVQREIAEKLLALDDESLTELGYDRDLLTEKLAR